MNSTLEAVDLGVSQVRGREEVTNDRKNSEEEAPDESVTMTYCYWVEPYFQCM